MPTASVGAPRAIHSGALLSADPFNSNDNTSAAAATASPVPQTDVNVVPVVGGTTEIGFGGGGFAGITRTVQDVQPYIWNIEAVAFATFKSENGFKSPFQDAYVKLTVPRLFGKIPLRMELRPSYTWETNIAYYGLGNASPFGPQSTASAQKHFQYERLHPTMDVIFRFPLADHWGAKYGAAYIYNRLDIDPDSQLGQEAASSTDPTVRRLLNISPDHSVMQFKYGMQYDTRDSEVSAHRGMFHEVNLKLSPGGVGGLPYRYAQVNVNTRFYAPIVRKGWLTFGTRVVGDVLIGDAPFYELARYDDTYAVGGPNGVRGVPTQRYYGKIKVFANTELRSELIRFKAFQKEIKIGPVAFFDAGRVWADTSVQPQLDGTGAGIHWGAGGGLRFQSGDAFVIRADVGGSPETVAGYFGVGQNF